MFRKRLALFVLLQGRQVRRRSSYQTHVIQGLWCESLFTFKRQTASGICEQWVPEVTKNVHGQTPKNARRGRKLAKLTDNASTLEEELAKTKVRNTMQSDPALEAFERLRVREVIAEGHDTASAFLAKFQSIAANLQPDERIKLVVYAYENSMELLKTVLSDPQANKICSLLWECDAKEDVTLVIPLLVNSCPELASLWVCFKHHSVLDFVSSLLEHPSNKLKVLERTGHAMGDFTRFFAALGQSQVSAIDVRGGESPEFARGLYKYLARDLLVRLKSITKLTLNDCRFVGGFDWSFLADSNVQELDFYSVRNVEGNQLGDALSAYLRAKGLDKLHLRDCDFANETLVVIGVNVGRIKRLMLRATE
ncbi:hypothetical protein BASA81_007871 [Batrachochytrium salamandrivorans]|nr:hypothetical protein BASA81_007871 [Batrachochytrium salamandrivorans]